MRHATLLILLCTFSIHAAELGCVFPAGGSLGTTFDVSVRGQGLRFASGALVSGTGVDAALVDVIPINPAMPGKRRKVPSLQDEVVFRITIAPGAQPGPRDLRVVCSNDITAPIAFEISRYPELLEEEPNDASLRGMTLPALPVCVNGRITEQDTDTFRFQAKQGQVIVAQVLARNLVPYIADAVPGWFQPVIKLLDAQGRELASQDDFRFDPDPILTFTAPTTGEYAVQITDAVRRGRDDFVYRLTLGELPLVTGFFPMGGKKGESLNIMRKGVNLASPRTRIFSGNKTSESCLQALLGDALAFPPLRFDLGSLPEVREADREGAPGQAQHLALPVTVNGTIDKPGECDVYRFDGMAGQTIALETRARQLGSPLDTLITLTDAAGRVVAMHDDQTNVFTGLLTDPSDSALTVRLQADGTYTVSVRDTRGKGGPDYHYRLRVSAPDPDFELWVTPSTVCIPMGGTVKAHVHVRRMDGFQGPINLQLDNPPLGIACQGGAVPAGATESTITLSASGSEKKLPHAPFELALSGVATNGDEVIRRNALPAHQKLQAFAYKHLVEDQVWLGVLTSQRRSYGFQVPLPENATALRATAHSPFDVTISSALARPWADFAAVKVIEPENGFAVTRIRDGVNPGEILVTLTCAEDEYAPPRAGNLIMAVSRKHAIVKARKRPDQAGELTPATPYVIEGR